MMEVVELIKASTQLAWPAILAVFLWKLYPVLKGIITSRSFSVKIAGMEVSVQDATEQFQTQIADLQKQVLLLRSAHPTNGAAPTFDSPPAASAVGQHSPRILWVDDKPAGNALEMGQIKELGIDITEAASTEDALAILNSAPSFNGVISDMGRREQGVYHAQAGLVFLNALRRAGHTVPFLVYSSQRNAARNNEEVKAAGGDGATASAVELLEWIARKVK
ncbi:response regulator [Bradyrhizobium sp. KB893862 SZCCT0404]|uniref:response regulator n=1 Tax=Bradyrhizobium sp. KB893862 SZCCT0404 TaxID=2807672 RepID=UPI001BA608CB|nr:response regulator [Bradyrhizobium sp. KB893862 SZCCT0404]MBR1177540.1 response regulator [Bradyrhizobium sp. KB893862 SZCCT0404]